MTPPLHRVLLGALILVSTAIAQRRAVAPPICESMPGNAALSLPLRWSHGTMQVLIEAQLLPTSGFVGNSLTGLRLRRPSFLAEPAYAAVTRTLTVRAAFTTRAANQMTQDLVGNRSPGLPVVFGPAAVNVAATIAAGPGTALGAEFLAIAFATPVPIVPGNLELEFEASDAPLTVAADNWVDAFWLQGGIEGGYATPIGNGGCTTLSGPLTLRWNGAPPLRGAAASLLLSGAAQNSLAIAFWGLDPRTHPISPGFFGYGYDLGQLASALGGCFQWAPIDVQWLGTTGPSGDYQVGFTVLSQLAARDRIAVQCAVLDPGRSGVPLSFSNGVLAQVDSTGAASHGTTVFFPGGALFSPWVPEPGQFPVLVLEY
jgi:hypothetical protein